MQNDQFSNVKDTPQLFLLNNNNNNNNNTTTTTTTTTTNTTSNTTAATTTTATTTNNNNSDINNDNYNNKNDDIKNMKNNNIDTTTTATTATIPFDITVVREWVPRVVEVSDCEEEMVERGMLWKMFKNEFPKMDRSGHNYNKFLMEVGSCLKNMLSELLPSVEKDTYHKFQGVYSYFRYLVAPPTEKPIVEHIIEKELTKWLNTSLQVTPLETDFMSCRELWEAYLTGYPLIDPEDQTKFYSLVIQYIQTELKSFHITERRVVDKNTFSFLYISTKNSNNNNNNNSNNNKNNENKTGDDDDTKNNKLIDLPDDKAILEWLVNNIGYCEDPDSFIHLEYLWERYINHFTNVPNKKIYQQQLYDKTCRYIRVITFPEEYTRPFKVLAQGFCNLRFLSPSEDPEAYLLNLDSSIIADSVFFEDIEEELACSSATLLQRDAEYLAYEVSELDSTPILDRRCSDLALYVTNDGQVASVRQAKGLEKMWATVQSNLGIKCDVNLKIVFEVELISEVNVSNTSAGDEIVHAVRCGWSQLCWGIDLGQVSGSFCIESTGSILTNNIRSDYTEPFIPGDVIVCYLDLKQRNISYSKNGEYLGVAFNIPEDMCKTFFPQISLKNMKVRVNFGLSLPIFSLIDDSEYCFLSEVQKELFVPSLTFDHEDSRYDIIHMSGLPLSGKTTWAENFAREHPQKQFRIIGHESILRKMEFDPKQQQIGSNMKTTIDTLYSVFCRISIWNTSNYIIDAKHSMDKLRLRNLKRYNKLKYKLTGVTMVVTDLELTKRHAEAKQRGIPVPSKAELLEMKCRSSIFRSAIFDKTIYGAEPEDSVRDIIAEYKEMELLLKKEDNSDKKRSRGGRKLKQQPIQTTINRGSTSDIIDTVKIPKKISSVETITRNPIIPLVPNFLPQFPLPFPFPSYVPGQLPFPPPPQLNQLNMNIKPDFKSQGVHARRSSYSRSPQKQDRNVQRMRSRSYSVSPHRKLKREIFTPDKAVSDSRKDDYFLSDRNHLTIASRGQSPKSDLRHYLNSKQKTIELKEPVYARDSIQHHGLEDREFMRTNITYPDLRDDFLNEKKISTLMNFDNERVKNQMRDRLNILTEPQRKFSHDFSDNPSKQKFHGSSYDEHTYPDHAAIHSRNYYHGNQPFNSPEYDLSPQTDYKQIVFDGYNRNPLSQDLQYRPIQESLYPKSSRYDKMYNDFSMDYAPPILREPIRKRPMDRYFHERSDFSTNFRPSTINSNIHGSSPMETSPKIKRLSYDFNKPSSYTRPPLN